MTKISKILTAAAALGVMGVAILPAASHAAGQTKVQVTVTDVCVIGDGSSGASVNGTNSGAQTLNLPLNGGALSGEVSSSSITDSNIKVTCNDQDGWALSEKTLTSETALTDGAKPSIAAWSSGTVPASFAVNTWGMKYSGTGVTATAYHAVTAGNTAVADATGNTTPSATIVQTFGAKIDGTIQAGSYTNDIVYTLAGK